MKKIKIILAFSLILFYKNSFSKQFNKSENITISKIENFFKNLKTIQGNFVQFSEINYGMSEGKFYVKKPQKIRFEYLNPNNLLIISNNNLINYYDRDLDEITVIPITKTPISLIFNNNFGLEPDRLNITDLIENPDGTKQISLKIIIDEIEYFVDYIFNNQINKILEISVSDSNMKTTLSLSNVLINNEIDDSIFIFNNPRLYKNRK